MPPTPPPVHTSRELLGWLKDPSSTRGIHVLDSKGWVLHTWRSVAAQARTIAVALGERGVAPGDRVAIADRGGPSFAAALFGTLLHGATAVPIPIPLPFQDRAARDSPVAEALALSKPRLVLCGEDLLATVGDEVERLGVASAPIPTAGTERDPFPPHPRADQVALLQLSSGTTGRRRAIAITLPALQANVDAISSWLSIGEEDATASWLPCHHDMGLVGCLLTPAACGSDLWWMRPERFLRDPLSYLQCFDGPRGATMSAMPAFGLAHVVRHLAPASVEGLDLRRWRVLIVGAERIAAATLTRFAGLLARAGFDVGSLLPAYGLAEATLAVSGNPPGARWRAVPVPGGLGQAVSCGPPLAGTEVVAVDHQGQPLPPGEVGEIAVIGPSVAAAILGAERASSARILPDGRLRTGDAGLIVDGEVVVLGRLDDGVKTRGRFIAAEDVEQALTEASLSTNRLAVAIGLDDDGLVTTLVVLERGDEDDAERARGVARLVAEGTRVVVVHASAGTIERTPNGKIRRRQLWLAHREARHLARATTATTATGSTTNDKAS